MKKFVLRLDLSDSNDKRKALKTISALPGIDEIAMDMNSKQLTVIGKVDPVTVVSKLRKHWTADIISVGPAKEPEPEKKEEPKKEEPKKEEEKKEEQPKEESKKEEAKKEEGKKEEEKKPMVGITMPYRQYYYHYPPMNTHYNYAHHHHSIEENPNACVIC